MKKIKTFILAICILAVCGSAAGCKGGGNTTSDAVSSEPAVSSADVINTGISSETSAVSDIKTDSKSAIDQTMQYNLNIFISNFVEANLRTFSENTDSASLIDFGIAHNMLNNSSYFENIEPRTFRESRYDTEYDCNVRIQKKYIDNTVKKYFGITLSDSDYEQYDLYENGYLYSEVTGGWSSQGFAVVSEITDLGNNEYEVVFDAYTDGYWFDRKDRYKLSPESIKNVDWEYKDETLDSRRKGSARFSASDINDRTTYVLKNYNID